ncbi:ABC transporter permease [Tropicimonas sp. IMCC34043]|uniref:ABC transporter permease n=1 Tax=Tropicimonas sp. IMCC34043 TaxID=2248760 RepID=UPI000E2448A3|nr:ABC transporter permease [Tropicimonas sp. IMCC34043]
MGNSASITAARAGVVSPEQRAEGRRAATMAGLRKVLLPAGTAGAALLIWEVTVRVLQIPPVLLPAPSAIWAKLDQLFLPLILKHSIPTITESLIAFVISTVIGIAIAGLLSSSRLLREALYPNVVFFQLIPKIALAPLFIVWLGIGAESRLSFAVFISFFPVVIATLAGLDNVDKSLLRLCRALRASEWQVFRDVRLPFALPYIFSGMKIATTFSIIGVIVGEFITSQAGLGYLILFASAQAETELIFAAITVLCVFGLVFYGAIALAEIYLRRRFGA